MPQLMKPLTDRRWRGYTLDELQTQRSINDARIMVQKISLSHELASLRTGQSARRGIFKKMVGALGYVDYAVLGVMALRRISSIISRFRGRR